MLLLFGEGRRRPSTHPRVKHGGQGITHSAASLPKDSCKPAWWFLSKRTCAFYLRAVDGTGDMQVGGSLLISSTAGVPAVQSSWRTILRILRTLRTHKSVHYQWHNSKCSP